MAILAVAGCGSGAARAVPEREATTSSAPATTGPDLTPVDGALQRTVVGTGDELDPGDEELRHVLLVGDSVLVLTADDLAERLPAALHIDAVECRELGERTSGGCGGVPAGTTVASGIEVLRDAIPDLADEGIVPDAVVIVLANNSSVTSSELDEAMRATAGIERVWWVNARIDGFGRQDTNNALIDELAERDERAGVVDWHGASGGRHWLRDHVHPNDAGQAALAEMVADHLRCGCVP